MDAFHEQKAIERQNREWADKKKRKTNLKKGHPWLQNDSNIKRTQDKIWNDILFSDNQIKE